MDSRTEFDQRVWATVVRTAVHDMLARVHEISTAVTSEVAARLPDLLDSPEAVEANRASTEASIRDFAERMLASSDPTELPCATHDYAVDGARRGVPLTMLMRSYRIAHAATANELAAILMRNATDPAELSRAGELCSTAMFHYVDTALCLAEAEYNNEREQWIRSAAAQRAETIDTILSGKPIDIDTASRRLRHDLRRVHVSAIAWLADHVDGRDPFTVLGAAIRDISAAIGCQHPLIHARGTLSIAAWISTNTEVPSRVLDDLRFRSALAPGVRVAIGEPGRAITGFVDSQTEALEAARVARLLNRPEGSITRFNDVALLALATTDLSRTSRFVERELGPLAGADEATRRLTTTVRTYLDESGSRARTAKRLHVHENTVAYRLRRAEELLGRPLDNRTLELRMALVLADAAPPATPAVSL